MSNLLEDHATAFIAALTGAGLTVYDGQVPDGAALPYVLVYTTYATPDGAVAPDAVDLTAATARVLDTRVYVHSVGETPQSARAVAAIVRAAVVDVTLAVSGRTCLRVRWQDGQPTRRDEEIPGEPVHDQADVYGWRSLAG